MTDKTIPEYGFSDTLFGGNADASGKETEEHATVEVLNNKDNIKTPAVFSKAAVVSLIVAISIISSAASVFVYDRYFATKLMAVDIKGYLGTQRDLYLAGKINDDQLAKSLDNLEMFVKALPKNRKIIMGDVAVRNIDVIKP